MIGPLNVFSLLFGGLLTGMPGQGGARHDDDSFAMDTAQVAARAADMAAKKATDARSDVQAMRAAIDKLILVDRALWEIIAESQGLTEEYLLDKVNEIDLRDGVLDGRMREPVRKCASCGKILQQGYLKCIYCGTKNEVANPFQNINTDSRDDSAQGIV
jgi:hypothetical protein